MVMNWQYFFFLIIIIELQFVIGYYFIESKAIWGILITGLKKTRGERNQSIYRSLSANDQGKNQRESKTMPKKTTSNPLSSPSSELSLKEMEELKNIFSKNKAVMGAMKSSAASTKPISAPNSVKKIIDTIPKEEIDSIKRMLSYNKMLMNNHVEGKSKSKQRVNTANDAATTPSSSKTRSDLFIENPILKELNKAKKNFIIPENLTEEEEIARIFERNKFLINYIEQEILKLNQLFTKKKIVSTSSKLDDWILKNNARYSKHFHGKPTYQSNFEISYTRDALARFLDTFEVKNPTILADINKDDELVYLGAIDESSYRFEDNHRIYLIHIDLHGLPLIPAIQIVKSSIHYYSEKYRNRNVDHIIIKYIVGIGRHSRENEPVLLPRIGKMLKQDYFFDVLSNKGEIIVRIEN